MKPISPAERARRARLAHVTRAAAIADTRPTTRPGSERTDLTVGDRVRAARTTGSTGTWARYDGREGIVVAVNAQTFPTGTTYVELGISWNPQRDLTKCPADIWFRADELERVAL